MFARFAKNLLFPPSRLANSFPWTLQTAGKEYFAGLLRFFLGSFLVPGLLAGAVFFLSDYPTLRASLLDPVRKFELLACFGLTVATLAACCNAFRLWRLGSGCSVRQFFAGAPIYLAAGLAFAMLSKWAIVAFEPYYLPSLRLMLAVMDGGDGKPSMTFLMVLSLISFVMGFGMQLRYIASRMRKSGISLAKAMALTIEPLKGSWWGATLFNVLLPVGIAYGITQLLGLTVVYLMGPAHQPTVDMARQATGGNFVLFALMAVVGAPVFEEVVFRGFLFQVIRCSLLNEPRALVLAEVPACGLRRYATQLRNLRARCSCLISQLVHRVLGGKRAELSAVVLSSLMFSLLHMQFQPTTLVMLFLLGCVQAEIYRRTGSLYCGMLLHALNNGIDVLKLALGQA